MTRSDRIDELLLAEYGRGGSAPYGTGARIAGVVGTSRELVRQRMAELGVSIEPRPGRELLKAALRERYPDGEVRRGDVARLVGEFAISRKTYVVVARELGLTFAPPDHGSLRRYRGPLRCRCAECRAANTQSMRDWTARKRELSEDPALYEPPRRRKLPDVD